jgi:hypothetical protein
MCPCGTRVKARRTWIHVIRIKLPEEKIQIRIQHELAEISVRGEYLGLLGKGLIGGGSSLDLLHLGIVAGRARWIVPRNTAQVKTRFDIDRD